MNFPSKAVSYNESVLSKFSIILRALPPAGTSAIDLFRAVSEKVSDISEFISVLDCLYALGKIHINEEGVLLHACTN